MFGVYIVCAIFGLAHAIPTHYMGTLVLPHENSNQNDLASASSNNVIQGPPTSNVFQENSGDVSAYPEYPDIPDIITQPGLVSDDVVFDIALHRSDIQNDVGDAVPVNYGLPNQEKIPVWKDLEYVRSDDENDQALYDDQEPTKLLMDIETDNYDDSENALPNPVRPLESLPNIYSTYVHEAMPSLEARGGYGIDILNPENIEFLSPNMRPTRSRGDDFMTDLAHETIMNNILPSMSFVRGAEEYPSYLPLRTAVYPRVASSACGMPILLNCNPAIVRGTVANSYPEYTPPAASVSPIRGDQAPDNTETVKSRSLDTHPFLNKDYYIQ